MERPYRHIDVERHGDVFCVWLQHNQLDETALHETGEELKRLIEAEGCRKMILSLGPEDLECLYSIFLAKLVSLQRRLREHGGALKIADASSFTIGIFEACRLQDLFDFAPDRATAIAAFAK
jgi:anti-anti-sigma factor